MQEIKNELNSIYFNIYFLHLGINYIFFLHRETLDVRHLDHFYLAIYLN